MWYVERGFCGVSSSNCPFLGGVSHMNASYVYTCPKCRSVCTCHKWRRTCKHSHTFEDVHGNIATHLKHIWKHSYTLEGVHGNIATHLKHIYSLVQAKPKFRKCGLSRLNPNVKKNAWRGFCGNFGPLEKLELSRLNSNFWGKIGTWKNYLKSNLICVVHACCYMLMSRVMSSMNESSHIGMTTYEWGMSCHIWFSHVMSHMNASCHVIWYMNASCHVTYTRVLSCHVTYTWVVMSHINASCHVTYTRVMSLIPKDTSP